MHLKNTSIKIPKFSEPATYQIKVQGEVRSEWADRLKGMQIIQDSDQETSSTISVLTGRISDQSALTGILNTLYEMHKVVLSVKLLEENKS